MHNFMQKNNSAPVRMNKNSGNLKSNTQPPVVSVPSKAVRINVSMPPSLRAVTEWVVSVKGYSGLSSYLQDCLRRDAAELGAKHFRLADPYIPAAMTHPDLTVGLAG